MGTSALLAQWLERAAVNRKVTGSIPVGSDVLCGGRHHNLSVCDPVGGMALCPSGQGVGLELRWALPAQVRTLSVSHLLHLRSLSGSAQQKQRFASRTSRRDSMAERSKAPA